MNSYRFITTDTFAELNPIPQQEAISASDVGTAAHVANHGHEPRGKGRWVFKCQQPNGEWVLLCFDGPGSYPYWSQARKNALTLARTLGFIRVDLLS